MLSSSLDFVDHLSSVEEPRMDRTKRHALIDILFVYVAGTIAGCDGSSDIASFAKTQLTWCRKFVEFKNGVPSHDTIGRVISLLTASAFAGYMAHQRDLLEKKSLYFSLAAWPLFAVGFSMCLHWGQFVNDGGSSYELLLHNPSIVLAFAVLPLAPLATVPLFMHYARHR